MHKHLIKEINKKENQQQAKHLMRFFKTAKGQYGEGDLFLGLKVPQTREIAKKYFKDISDFDIQKLLENEYHEIRLCALLIMVLQYEKIPKRREDLFNLYLKNVQYINNWDLVDLSCTKLFGRHVFETKDFSKLYALSDSNHLWSKRISVVSTYYFIKRGEFDLIKELAEKFLYDKHDLMQKAVGWMLREMGKMDIAELYSFLDKHHKVMPRTMLRYSIEKLTPEKKMFYMGKIKL